MSANKKNVPTIIADENGHAFAHRPKISKGGLIMALVWWLFGIVIAAMQALVLSHNNGFDASGQEYAAQRFLWRFNVLCAFFFWFSCLMTISWVCNQFSYLRFTKPQGIEIRYVNAALILPWNPLRVAVSAFGVGAQVPFTALFTALLYFLILPVWLPSGAVTVRLVNGVARYNYTKGDVMLAYEIVLAITLVVLISGYVVVFIKNKFCAPAMVGFSQILKDTINSTDIQDAFRQGQDINHIKVRYVSNSTGAGFKVVS